MVPPVASTSSISASRPPPDCTSRTPPHPPLHFQLRVPVSDRRGGRDPRRRQFALLANRHKALPPPPGQSRRQHEPARLDTRQRGDVPPLLLAEQAVHGLERSVEMRAQQRRDVAKQNSR